ncbi:MAG: hypothetical protein CMF23_09135 [Ignavibacteriae bacterium]|nr:hypothetical protein [Ignavibacteriota bacterium]
MNFSIIIPTLNEIKLLPNLINQINDEKLKSLFNYEIIISDGGSNDGTIDFALNNSDKVIVHSDKNRKQNIGEGRNIGAANSESNILIFLNGDIEISDPKKLFEIITKKFSKSDFAAMTCRVDIHPNEEILTDKIFLGFYNVYFHFLNIIGVGMGRGEIHIIKRDIFTKVNGYNEKLAAGEDFDLFKRIRKIGKIYFCNDVTIFESPRRYREHGHLSVFFKWLLNSIYVVLFKRSLSKEWEQVR